jgi:hypothetical protein
MIQPASPSAWTKLLYIPVLAKPSLVSLHLWKVGGMSGDRHAAADYVRVFNDCPIRASRRSGTTRPSMAVCWIWLILTRILPDFGACYDEQTEGLRCRFVGTASRMWSCALPRRTALRVSVADRPAECGFIVGRVGAFAVGLGACRWRGYGFGHRRGALRIARADRARRQDGCQALAHVPFQRVGQHAEQ